MGFEVDADCCETYSRNLGGECARVELTPTTDLPDAPVLVGGPPCQPFSVGGKQLGLTDSRDGFPTFISAVARVQPAVWLIENVRGLYYRSRPYLNEVLRALRELDYEIAVELLNARQFGVPQNRERVIIVGHRSGFAWPDPAPHIRTAGDAVGDTAHTAPEGSKFLTESMDQYVARYEKASDCINPRDLHLDRPARTLTCRNLAGATGDMHRVRLPDGRRRRLFLREAARLQSFPDWYEFSGTETNQFNQIGNAVAPVFARRLAESVRSCLGLAPDHEQGDTVVHDGAVPRPEDRAGVLP